MRTTMTIARGTLRELLRSRVTILPLVLLGFAMLSASIIRMGPTVAERVDSSSSVIDVFAILVLLVAAAAGCGQISEEIDHGTIKLLVVRPVSRMSIVGGKLLGAWAYASIAMLSWCAGIGVVLAARGFGTDPILATFEAGLWRLPVVGLVVAIAVFGSTLLGTRMAFGFTVLAWLVGWMSGQAHQLYQAKEPILSWVPDLAPIVAAMTWAIPLRRLQDWADRMAGTLETDTFTATGNPLPQIYGSTDDLVWGLVAVGVWTFAAMLAFRLRRSLT